MEDLPVTLDDGELWIPSDIFPTEELHHHHHHNRSIPDAAASMEDLNLRFCKLNSDHDFVVTPSVSSLSQKLGGYIRAMAQYSVANPTPTSNGFFEVAVGPNGVDRRRVFNNDSGFVHHTPCPPALPFPMHSPAVYTQGAEQLMETGVGRSNRPGYNRQQHNRLLPSQASGRGYGFGFGLTRGCCSRGNSSSTSSGTGVFIPRTNCGSFEGCKSKPGVRSKIPPRKLRTRKADDYNYHPSLPSPEVVLPKEWTY